MYIQIFDMLPINKNLASYLASILNLFLLIIKELMRNKCVLLFKSNHISISGGYEDFSALYPFLRTQKIIYMPKVRYL